jgi:hypothetical protein
MVGLFLEELYTADSSWRMECGGTEELTHIHLAMKPGDERRFGDHAL